MSDSGMLWAGAGDLTRPLVVTPLAYAALILILRVSGKRMLSKMSAFDFVVTIALGSTLATTLLSQEVSLARGVATLGVLVGLQFLVAWSAARSSTVRRIAKSEPALLYSRGEFLVRTMHAENVPADAILAAMRQKGFGTVDEVDAVVLESDGSLSILRRAGADEASTLRDLKRR